MSQVKERTVAQIVRGRPDLQAAFAEHTLEINIPFRSRCICCARDYDSLADLGTTCIRYRDGQECRGAVLALSSKAHGGSDTRTSAEIKEDVLAKHRGI